MNRRVDYKGSSKSTAKKVRSVTRKKADVPSKNNSTVASDSSSMFQGWLAHHRYSCIDSLQRLLSAPWQSLLTWMVVAIALVLPAILYVGLHNVQKVGQGWQNSVQMSAFLAYQAKPLAIEQLQQRLQTSPELASIDLITPEQAKQEFQRYSGLGNILESLDDNPLPAVFILVPTIKEPQKLQALQHKLESEPLIDIVQLDVAWLQRLYQITNLSQRVVLAITVLLALGVLLIIGNTIRLAIENRREEIIVVKMVGGTDGFVRRPFLYAGFWYGIGGGILSLLLLLAAGQWLQQPVEKLLFLYGSNYSLTWIDFNIILYILSGSSFIGWSGAWLAVAKHLKNIEPS